MDLCTRSPSGPCRTPWSTCRPFQSPNPASVARAKRFPLIFWWHKRAVTVTSRCYRCLNSCEGQSGAWVKGSAYEAQTNLHQRCFHGVRGTKLCVSRLNKSTDLISCILGAEEKPATNKTCRLVFNYQLNMNSCSGCPHKTCGQGGAASHGRERSLVPQPQDRVLRGCPDCYPTAGRRVPSVRVEPSGGVQHRRYDGIIYRAGLF